MDRDRMSRRSSAAGAVTRLQLLSIAALAVFTAGLAMALLGTGGQTGLEAERASAATKKKLITGTLSKPGYTVIALAADGEAKTARAAADGSFSLAPPAGTATLHLRAPDGTYAGPMIVAGRWNLVKVAKKELRRAEKKLKKAKNRASKAGGKKAIRRAKRKVKEARSNLKTARKRASGKQVVLGVEAGAQLGIVNVEVAKGYAKAKLKQRQWKKWVFEKSKARAKNGVPIGAGNFGVVHSKKTKGGAPGDLDLDGVANQLDVDANGNKVLDDTERPSSSARASEVGGVFPGGSKIDVRSALDEYDKAANANGGSTDERIADAQAHWGRFNIYWIGIDPGSGELDCGGLTYCSRGGTGRWIDDPDVKGPEPAAYPPFPECCDLDDDGFGSLIDVKGESESQSSFCGSGCGTGLYHGATADEIGTGDVLVLRSTVNGVEVQSATTMGFAFSTPPVYAGYDDGQGNSRGFSYATVPCAASPCTVPVRARPDGDVIVDLSIWRPQRSRLESDPGQGKWIDMGNLTYLADLGLLRDEPDGPTLDHGGCPQGSLSEGDPSLAPPTPAAPLWPGNEDHYEGWGGFRDSSSDQPQDPANTLTFTLNLSQCVASRGLDLEPGDGAMVVISAWAVGVDGSTAQAQSYVSFKVQP